MTSIEANRGLIVQAAKRQYGRLQGLNMDVDFEDLVQEGSAVCLECARHFKAEKGYRFSTYLVTALNNHFNRDFNRMIQRSRHETPLPEQALERDASERSPEELLQALQEAQQIKEGLSPEAKTLLAELMRHGIDKFKDAKVRLVGENIMSPGIYRRARRELIDRTEALYGY